MPRKILPAIRRLAPGPEEKEEQRMIFLKTLNINTGHIGYLPIHKIQEIIDTTEGVEVIANGNSYRVRVFDDDSTYAYMDNFEDSLVWIPKTEAPPAEAEWLFIASDPDGNQVKCSKCGVKVKRNYEKFGHRFGPRYCEFCGSRMVNGIWG